MIFTKVSQHETTKPKPQKTTADTTVKLTPRQVAYSQTAGQTRLDGLDSHSHFRIPEDMGPWYGSRLP